MGFGEIEGKSSGKQGTNLSQLEQAEPFQKRTE